LVTTIVVNALLYVGICSRMVPAQALFSAVPEPTERGAFNAIMASLSSFQAALPCSPA
jgi:hypothetical protein